QRLRDVLQALGLLAAFDDADDVGPAALDVFDVAFTLSQTHPPGIEGEQFTALGSSRDVTLAQPGDDWRIALQLAAGFGTGVILRLLPPASLEVEAEAAVAGDVRLALLGQSADATRPFILFGQSGGSRVQAGKIEAGL